MVTPLFEAFESCAFDSQSVEMLDELERIAEELLEMTLLELDLCAELLESFSLELLSLTLDELLAACEELDLAILELDSLLELDELEDTVPEQAV